MCLYPSFLLSNTSPLLKSNSLLQWTFAILPVCERKNAVAWSGNGDLLQIVGNKILNSWVVPLGIFFSVHTEVVVKLLSCWPMLHRYWCSRHILTQKCLAEPQQRHRTAELRHNHMTPKLVAKACYASKCAFIYAFVKIFSALGTAFAPWKHLLAYLRDELSDRVYP